MEHLITYRLSRMPNINAILQDLQSPGQCCQAELNVHKVFSYLPRRRIAILTWF